MAKSFHKSHSMNIVIPHDVYLMLQRFSELTGFTEREIVLCVLRDELNSFRDQHPDLFWFEYRDNPEI